MNLLLQISRKLKNIKFINKFMISIKSIMFYYFIKFYYLK